MKPIIIPVFILCISLISCDVPSEEAIIPEDGLSGQMAPGQHFVNFNAVFYSVFTPTDEDAGCEAPQFFQVKQEGDGTAAQLGKFRFEALFCVDPATGEYGSGATGYGKFIFEDGDILYSTVSGQVVPSDHPKYDSQFQDDMQFIGGTGRFAGSYGEAVTDSYVTFFADGDSTVHHWQGTLMLPAGK